MSGSRVFWNVDETLLLLEIFKENKILDMMDGKKYRRSDIYKIVEREFKKMNIVDKNGLHIENKWKNLKKNYMAARKTNNRSETGEAIFEYYDELENMLGERPTSSLLANPLDTSSNNDTATEVMDKKRRDALLDFIKTYRSFPELWDRKHKDYKNRSKKTKCYDRLVEKLKVIESNATRESVVKKINCLRSNFRKELYKIQNAKLSERYTDEEDDYMPSLWYFDQFLFLTEDESNVKSNTDDNELDKESVCSNDINYESSPPSYEYVSVKSEMPLKRKRPLTAASEKTQIVHSPKSATEDILAYAIKHMDKEEDEYLLMAKTYATKLKKMEPLQRLYADRIINEILMEGQLGTLERYTSITNPDTQEQIEISGDRI